MVLVLQAWLDRKGIFVFLCVCTRVRMVQLLEVDGCVESIGNYQMLSSAKFGGLDDYCMWRA